MNINAPELAQQLNFIPCPEEKNKEVHKRVHKTNTTID